MSNDQGKTQEVTRNVWKEKIPLFIAITTLVLAACATLASFKAAGYGNKMVLAQNQASDQWAFYQAKSMKETSYELAKDSMVLTLDKANNTSAVSEKIAKYNEEIARYRNEKNEIANQAKILENERDVARNFNLLFGRSLIFLQIGILLSSLATVNKNYIYWYIGAATGLIGVTIFLYALTL